MASFDEERETPPCPGCGITDLRGPFEAGTDDQYWECQHCDRHVYQDELDDADPGDLYLYGRDASGNLTGPDPEYYRDPY